MVFQRFLYDERGKIRVRRLVPTLIVTFIFAMFGPAMLYWVPRLTDSEAWRWVGVFFTTIALKIPLMLLLFVFIKRNIEIPGQPVVWGDREVSEILDSLRQKVAEAEVRPDRIARLRYLSGEAWNVADQISGPARIDALTIALQIDERLIEWRERPGAPAPAETTEERDDR